MRERWSQWAAQSRLCIVFGPGAAGFPGDQTPWACVRREGPPCAVTRGAGFLQKGGCGGRVSSAAQCPLLPLSGPEAQEPPCEPYSLLCSHFRALVVFWISEFGNLNIFPHWGIRKDFGSDSKLGNTYGVCVFVRKTGWNAIKWRFFWWGGGMAVIHFIDTPYFKWASQVVGLGSGPPDCPERNLELRIGSVGVWAFPVVSELWTPGWGMSSRPGSPPPPASSGPRRPFPLSAPQISLGLASLLGFTPRGQRAGEWVPVSCLDTVNVLKPQQND